MSDRVVTDIEELLSLLTLRRTRTYEVKGMRRDADPEAESEFETPEKRSMDFETVIVDTDENLTVRLRAEMETRLLTGIRADVGVIYAKVEPFDIDTEVLTQFTKEVAVMQIYPYFRQIISDTTSRLGSMVTLGTIMRSNVEVNPPALD